MYSDEVKKIAEKCDDRSYMTSLGKAKSPTGIGLILEATSWMDKYWGDVKIENKLRCQVINLGYTEDTFPRCEVCGKLATGNGRGDTHTNRFCSNECRVARKRFSDDILEKLNSFTWMYEQRITNKMSKQAIADLLGCSDGLVSTMIKKLGIPMVKYNEAPKELTCMLENKEWLYDEYVVKHRPAREIGDELGVGIGIVLKYLKKYGIPISEPNSYERKFKKVSKAELEIGEFITSLGFTVTHGNRRMLGGLEIDIMIEGSDVCFEFNGLFSHCHEYINADGVLVPMKEKDYHLNKTLLAKDLGLRLYHIWSDEWEFKKPIVKSMIKSKLGVIDKKIYARNCSIVELTSAEKGAFMRSNHIQGNCKSSFNYALKYGSEIVACMTFKKTTARGCSWELMRFASKIDTTVVGGFSKLIKKFLSEHNGSLLSYADVCYSNGNVYYKHEFKLIATSPPQYWYSKDRRNRLHRANFMKKKIGPNDTRTEKEIMLTNGYIRIYGCGTQAWVLSR